MVDTKVDKSLARKIAEELKQLEGETGKDFKLGYFQKAGYKRNIKKNKVLTFLMKTNGSLDIKWRQIMDDQVYIKETDSHHMTTTDCIGYYKGYPVIIVCEWDLRALSRQSLLELTEHGRYSNPQKVIIHNIMKAMGQMKMKPKFGGSVIWIILIVGVLLYLVYQALI